MKAIVFDLDGTLLDVREGIYWQFEQLTEHFDGKPVSREEIAATMHGTTGMIVRTLVKNEAVPFEDVLTYHTALRQQAYNKFLRLYPGVDELLPILRRMGLRVAALTSGNEMTVQCLEVLGVAKYFDVVVAEHHLTQPKPHAEGIMLISERLSVSPSEIVMVGDTVVDIFTGKNGGVGKTVAITHGFGNLAALQAAEPDHIIHDIPSLLDVIE